MTLKTAQRHLKELLKPYHVDHTTLMKALNILESLHQRNREQEAGVASESEIEDQDWESEDEQDDCADAAKELI